MDDEMEEVLEGGFFGEEEVDLDYEFDAVRFFDLGREETPVEAREAERWFYTARSYPPSPFVERLYAGKDAVVENVNTLPKFKDVESISGLIDHSDLSSGLEFLPLDKSSKDLVLHGYLSQNVAKDDVQSTTKTPFSKGSTLMKPTACQLAKQNRVRDVKNANQFRHRFRKPILVKSDKSSEDLSDNVCQAAKRQKLDGGHICKVVGLKHQSDLTHKLPQKTTGPIDCNSQSSRLKLTIPREPELETAQRAQRLRDQRMRSNNKRELQEGTLPNTAVFKARPLNRKILEAPSLPLPQKSKPRLPEFQEFNLKTNERAVQHSHFASSNMISGSNIPCSTMHGGGGMFRKSQYQKLSSSQLQNDDKKSEGCRKPPSFVARPLDKKILSSKGDIGVFKSTKREVTVPKEFNFASSKRSHQNPPVELFSKLSLNSKVKPSGASQTRVPQTIAVATKGLKENEAGPFQDQKGIYVNMEWWQKLERKHIQVENGVVSGSSSQFSTFRSLGIR